MTRPFAAKSVKSTPNIFIRLKATGSPIRFKLGCFFLDRIGQTVGGICILIKLCTCASIQRKIATPSEICFNASFGKREVNWIADTSCTSISFILIVPHLPFQRVRSGLSFTSISRKAPPARRLPNSRPLEILRGTCSRPFAGKSFRNLDLMIFPENGHRRRWEHNRPKTRPITAFKWGWSSSATCCPKARNLVFGSSVCSRKNSAVYPMSRNRTSCCRAAVIASPILERPSVDNAKIPASPNHPQ